mmetsp:Transcript_29435/g.46149  ORF Transcript_29435/g.46149 Transcript_29435/m.46149 type:complete len:90 (-) Transcript_29435:732-1001(-)
MNPSSVIPTAVAMWERTRVSAFSNGRTKPQILENVKDKTSLSSSVSNVRPFMTLFTGSLPPSNFSPAKEERALYKVPSKGVQVDHKGLP